MNYLKCGIQACVPACAPNQSRPHTEAKRLPMNIPPVNAEPPSFADRLADIRFLQQRAATAARVLLASRGWRQTALNPSRSRLWSRKLPDGRTLLTDLDTALAIEASLTGSRPQLASPPAQAGKRRKRRTQITHRAASASQ